MHCQIKISVILPDHPCNNVQDGYKGITKPLHIASLISSNLASKSLVARVNGQLWDMTRPLEADCDIRFYSYDDEEGKDIFWHSSAHILGMCMVKELKCCPCVGSCSASRGDQESFSYDVDVNLNLNEGYFERIQDRFAEVVKANHPFERLEVSREQALEMFSDNKFKLEIINDLPEDEARVILYRCGEFVDLCVGPHIPNTSFVKSFSCLEASSAYWKGSPNCESVQRVYAVSYPNDKLLSLYKKRREEAKQYDHRKLGVKQELFFCDPLSPGSWSFLPQGTRIYNKLVEFFRSEYRKRGYDEVITPIMYNMKLWEISGHAANYRDNMFVFDVDNQEFGLKPMNCPAHCRMFGQKVRSYRELPMRLADFGVLHRNEASGALSGLTRVLRFQQDDAHIFCREGQVKDEVRNVLDFINYVYGIFGFSFELKLSTRPQNYLGNVATWEKAEAALTEALNESGKPWKLNEGDGAFYGPKIDISVSDVMKRKFQCATLQLDFQLPVRFNLTYAAEEGKWETPIIIHRAILGSVERMFAILLEHYKGKWPFWLSPRQVVVCSIPSSSEESAIAKSIADFSLEVQHQIFKAGYHVDVDVSNTPFGKKISQARVWQYNYILVVGEKEVKNKTVAVRARDSHDHIPMTMEQILEHFKGEIEAFH